MRSSLEDSRMTVVSSWLTSPRNSKEKLGSEGAEWERGRKIGNFWPISRRISETVQDRGHSYNDRFRLVPKSPTLDDLERPKRRLAEKIVLRSPLGWISWKLIGRIISPTFSLFVAQRAKAIHLLPGAAVSLKHVKVEEKLLWMAYKNSPTLFRTVPSPTPYSLLFPILGVCNPTQNFNCNYLGNG